jgi:hypothetical protein
MRCAAIPICRSGWARRIRRQNAASISISCNRVHCPDRWSTIAPPAPAPPAQGLRPPTIRAMPGSMFRRERARRSRRQKAWARKAPAIAPKNSSPTIFSTTGKRPLGALNCIPYWPIAVSARVFPAAVARRRGRVAVRGAAQQDRVARSPHSKNDSGRGPWPRGMI